jgi:hypothetical protein
VINDERAKANQLKQRQEKRIASQMQRRVIETNVDENYRPYSGK